jgi:hypothetical protein
MVMVQRPVASVRPASVPYSSAVPKATTTNAYGKATPTLVAAACFSNYYCAGGFGLILRAT